MKKDKMLKKLNKQTTKVLGVVTHLVSALEQVNEKNEDIVVALECEITDKHEQRMDVLTSIKDNKKVIENFKNLLK